MRKRVAQSSPSCSPTWTISSSSMTRSDITPETCCCRPWGSGSGTASGKQTQLRVTAEMNSSYSWPHILAGSCSAPCRKGHRSCIESRIRHRGTGAQRNAQHWHQPLPLRRHRCRGADQERRRGDVPRERDGAEQLPRKERLAHAAAGASARSSQLPRSCLSCFRSASRVYIMCPAP